LLSFSIVKGTHYVCLIFQAAFHTSRANTHQLCGTRYVILAFVKKEIKSLRPKERIYLGNCFFTKSLDPGARIVTVLRTGAWYGRQDIYNSWQMDSEMQPKELLQ
jgi:hypothetical protein